MNTAEPMTMVTDYMLCCVALYYSMKLLNKDEGYLCRLLWSLGFFLIAYAAATGGYNHGWKDLLQPIESHSLWSISYCSIALADWCLFMGLLVTVRDFDRKNYVAPSMILAALVTLSFALGDEVIIIALWHVAILGALLLVSIAGRIQNNQPCRFIIAGVAVSVIAALIQLSSVRIGPFSHDDLFHLAQIPAFPLFYHKMKKATDEF